MKKVLSMVLFFAMILSFTTGFTITSLAEKITVDKDHIIPYAQPADIPTIDGKLTSGDEWENALKITIDKNTDGASTSDIDGTGTTEESTSSASLDAYVLYSATLDGFESDDDIMWDYIPGDDPIGGLYFRFDVKDTTQAFAAGENGLGLLNLNATDCVQIALNGDPDNAGSGLTGKEWLYTFSGYTAGAPGVGEIPSGNGAWYEHWATGGGNAQTHGGYNIQIKASMDVDFDPAYPLPEGDLSIDDPGYKEWKKQRDDAFEHITNYRGYTIEAFIEWEAFNMGEGMFVLPIEGQKLGMGLILLNYMYDWEGNGPVASRQALVWGKSNIGSTNDGWPVLGTPALFPTYQLGSHEQTTTDSDYSVEGTVTAPIEGKTSVTLSVTTPSESNLVGIKVEVAFNTEKLTLIQETNNSNYFIGQMIPHQTVFTDAANGRIALTAIALTGNKSDVFSGGTADFAKLKFSVADTAVLEDNDITITVTDAVNVNAETIFEKFGTSVTYKELDTRALEAAIEKATHLNADEYTTDTFSEVNTALEKAIAILADENATQHDLDTAAQTLEQKMAALIKTHRVDGTVSIPHAGKTSALLTVTTPANANLAGITVKVSFNTEKLTLIPEKNESDYFVGKLIPNQVGLVSINPGKIALQAVALTGNANDVFPGGTADFVKLNFKVSEDTILEEGDITVTVTDAANFDLETITEKFGTSVTYIKLDTQALKAAIEKAENLNSDEYTTETFSAMMTTLKKATAILTDVNATQDDIDSATESLEQSIAALIRTYRVDGTVSAPRFDTTSVSLTVTTPANTNLAGITVKVSFNTEKLTLIPEKNESDYFVGKLIPNQVGLVSINPGKIALQAVALTGNANDVFPGGTADFVKLNFKVSEDTILEEGDITVTVTDAANFNLETITEKFGTSVTYLRLDTSALETAIEKAKILDEGVYTTDSFQAVQQALSIAETVLEKENVTQQEVDNATAALEDAINKLVKAAIIGIEITPPTKVYYLTGEKFVADGFIVQNIYQNGKKEFTIGIYTVPNMNTIGVKVIDVTVGNFKGSFTVYVSTKGDINADGKISLVDVVSVARAAVESMQNSNSAEIVYGDVIGNDGKVTLIDVLKLARVSLGVDTID